MCKKYRVFLCLFRVTFLQLRFLLGTRTPGMFMLPSSYLSRLILMYATVSELETIHPAPIIKLLSLPDKDLPRLLNYQTKPAISLKSKQTFVSALSRLIVAYPASIWSAWRQTAEAHSEEVNSQIADISTRISTTNCSWQEAQPIIWSDWTTFFFFPPVLPADKNSRSG